MAEKICHITIVHPAFDVRIFFRECVTLSQAGYDVTLIAQHNKDEVVDGIKIVALPKTKNRLKRMALLPLKALFKALKEKADVYHFHDPEFLPIAVLLEIFTRAKIIYDVHEDVPKQILQKYWIPRFLRNFVAIITNVIEKSLSSFFDAIVTATDNIASNFKKHRRVISLRNYPVWNFRVIGSRPELKADNNVFNVVYIGTISPHRGITQVIRALEILYDNVKLILAGKFSPESYGEEVRSLKGFEKVEYRGFVDYFEVPKILKEADAGVVAFLPEPNHVTAGPNKLFEYMAVGLPVIASDFPMWREIVEGSGCGICVNPIESEEIANAIKYLSEHPEEARRMGENGRKAVLEKYNWEIESRKLIEVYKKLLHSE